jgi:hypothetical protein
MEISTPHTDAMHHLDKSLLLKRIVPLPDELHSACLMKTKAASMDFEKIIISLE